MMTKNITLSADETLIERAKEKARQENTSLNKLFREWVTKYISRDNIDIEFDNLMQSLQDVRPGRKFSRDEMNER
jgi:hypothetical protein